MGAGFEAGMEGEGHGLKWRRGVEGEAFSRAGVGEGEFGGVEFHSSRCGAVSVEGVSDDRDAEPFFMRGVDAELVGAAGDGVKGDAGEAVFDPEIFPMRDADLSVDFVVDLVRAVVDIEAEGEGDRSFRFEKFTFEEGEVVLVGEAVLKLPREVPVCLAC